VEDVVEHIETELTTILNKKSWAYKRIGEFIHPALEHIEKLLNSQGILGISTGYSSIDDYTGGFIDSEVTIIGARASMGKTAIALNMAENISKQNIPVGFISLEMQGKLLALRILCGLSKIDMWKIRAGMIDRKDFDRLYDAGRSINEYPLYLYEYPNARLLDIKLKARLMKRQEGIKILFIDYIGLIRTDQDTPRWEEVGYISSELKALARELEIPIVVCCQVNRDAEGKPPTLANLRESGSIEQDADVVMFLHRKRDSQNSELIISKNRNGGTGKIDLYFIMERTRFEEVTKEIA
jgi:replicative DNA helicase